MANLLVKGDFLAKRRLMESMPPHFYLRLQQKNSLKNMHLPTNPAKLRMNGQAHR